MRYRDLQIQTQREAPNNARTAGYAFLVRAGYLTRENLPTPLGELAIQHLQAAPEPAVAALATLRSETEIFFPSASGEIELAHCPACHYTARLELATFGKPAGQILAAPLPAEKVLTPDCSTIEALANYLSIPKEQTAKALMYTRLSDGRFVFVVVRGDLQASQAKLQAEVGEVRAATQEEILRAGAVPGYASPVGLQDALIVVDDLIPRSSNLVAGANQAGYHLKNTNYGRDYSAAIVADLSQARAGDPCVRCSQPLSIVSAVVLVERTTAGQEPQAVPENILLALAESFHDDKGLTLPQTAAPLRVYLMQVTGKELDTRAQAESLYTEFQNAGLAVLFDDRDERAGVKFNDADLIGCPVRVTVGEKALKTGTVELKWRTEKENRLVAVEKICAELSSALK